VDISYAAKTLGKALGALTLGGAGFLVFVRRKSLSDERVGSVLVLGTAASLLSFGAGKLFERK
jgi:hypothetical protein